MTSPILFMCFNRPHLTEQVFAAVRLQQPERLYVSVDGPREDRPDDVQKCKDVIRIVKNIDWDCDVHYRILPRNAGCRDACVSAIDWFFEHESEGIILEDDVLPHPDFFPYCTTLLDRYRDTPDIGSICGSPPIRMVKRSRRTDQDYFYSKHNHIWGWATWADRWATYDRQLLAWDLACESPDRPCFFGQTQEETDGLCTRARLDIDNTWDAQWTFDLMQRGRRSVMPYRPLIQNIGFGSDATHTTDTRHPSIFYSYFHSNIGKQSGIHFPLRSPQSLKSSATEDQYMAKHIQNVRRLLNVKRGLKSGVKNLLTNKHKVDISRIIPKADRKAGIEGIFQKRRLRQRLSDYKRMAAGTPVFCECEGTKFHLHAKDYGVSCDVYLGFNRDRTLLKTIRNIIGADLMPDTIIDVGANIGTTCVTGVNEGWFRNAIAFEPISDNFALLQKNITENKLGDRITAHNMALGHVNRNAQMSMIIKQNSGDFRIQEEQSDDSSLETVRVATLDQFITKDVARKSLLWLDVQGHELEVLQGAAACLSHLPPLVLEFDPGMVSNPEKWRMLLDILSRYSICFDLNKPSMVPLKAELATLSEISENLIKGGVYTDLLLL